MCKFILGCSVEPRQRSPSTVKLFQNGNGGKQPNTAPFGNLTPMTRKLPALTADTAPFWQGGARGVLQIHYCAGCHRFFHPPNPICPACNSFEVAPLPVSGKGRVVTFTINRHAWTPQLAEPYVVAVIELAEQANLRLLSNIVGCDSNEVAIGMPVSVTFAQFDDVWIPLFERTRDV
jgi:uncharacterized protein